MKKDAIIKYLPHGTTQEEIKRISNEFKDENATLILMISGKEKLLDCLQLLINV